ncbi:MAG TPA: MFS transporter [Pseudonocardia sp.]|nr:MFS transporter [Pseudonocardia sp.]
MPRIDVADFMSRSTLGRTHLRVAVLCGICLLADGYDVGIFGAVVPSLIREWHLSGTLAGLLGTASLAGMLVGAITLGAAADRIGRKPTMIAALLVFSVFAGLSALSPGPLAFGLLRFASGLGLGGVLPIAATLSSEYAPARWRSPFIMWTSVGFAAGGLLSALVSRLFVAEWGWRAVVGTGAFPLLLIPVLVGLLPESLEQLLRRGRTARARRIMAGIDGPYPVDASATLHVSAGGTGPKASPARLFEPEYRARTVLLSVAFCGCLLMLYAILTWLPQFVANAGFSVSSGLTMLVLLNGGGMLGMIVNGTLASRLPVVRVLVGSYLLTALALLLLGFAQTAALVAVSAFFAGLLGYASSVAENAYPSVVYPAQLRATATGWCLGIGRIGGMIGPYLGGALLDARLPVAADYAIFALAGVISAGAVLAVHRLGAGRPGNPSAQLGVEVRPGSELGRRP